MLKRKICKMCLSVFIVFSDHNRLQRRWFYLRTLVLINEVAEFVSKRLHLDK